MEIGRLKHRLRVYHIVNSVNDEGTPIRTKETVATPFCEVLKTTIKEFKEIGLDGRKKTIDFIIRYRQKSEIQSDMMVEFKGQELKIIYVEPDYQNSERMMLKCEVVE